MADKYNQSWVMALAQPGTKMWAITIRQTTYYSCSKSMVSDRWRRHEECHKNQWAKYGWKFALMYLAEQNKNGYHNNRFEIEARFTEEV